VDFTLWDLSVLYREIINENRLEFCKMEASMSSCSAVDIVTDYWLDGLEAGV
jgi:hypothetical protein